MALIDYDRHAMYCRQCNMGGIEIRIIACIKHSTINRFKIHRLCNIARRTCLWQYFVTTKIIRVGDAWPAANSSTTGCTGCGDPCPCVTLLLSYFGRLQSMTLRSMFVHYMVQQFVHVRFLNCNFFEKMSVENICTFKHTKIWTLQIIQSLNQTTQKRTLISKTILEWTIYKNQSHNQRKQS